MDGSEGDLRLQYTLQTLNIHGQHSWASCMHACARVRVCLCLITPREGFSPHPLPRFESQILY